MSMPKLFASLPVLTGGTYVVVVPHYWGRGDTLREALAQCRRAGASKIANARRILVAWQSDADAMKGATPGETIGDRRVCVDDLGIVHHAGGLVALYRRDRGEP